MEGFGDWGGEGGIGGRCFSFLFPHHQVQQWLQMAGYKTYGYLLTYTFNNI
jgi:hypothetical protein